MSAISTSSTISRTAPGFFAGTRLATPNGDMAVEALRPGDMVMTGDGPRLVRWIGQSPICTRAATLPIRITARALHAGLPRRDLLLSPDQAIFLAGLLIPAGLLVNATTILRAAAPAQGASYQLALDSHALLLAEGVAVESLVDAAAHMALTNGANRTGDAPTGDMAYPRVHSTCQIPAFVRAVLNLPEVAQVSA